MHATRALSALVWHTSVATVRLRGSGLNKVAAMNAAGGCVPWAWCVAVAVAVAVVGAVWLTAACGHRS